MDKGERRPPSWALPRRSNANRPPGVSAAPAARAGSPGFTVDGAGATAEAYGRPAAKSRAGTAPTASTRVATSVARDEATGEPAVLVVRADSPGLPARRAWRGGAAPSRRRG